MKKILIPFFLFFCVQIVSAQTDKGDWMVGGTFSLNTAKNSTTISLSPNAGYFLLDHFLLGARVGYEFSELGTTKVSAFDIGPFTRYYFRGKRARPFGEFDLDFQSAKLTTDLGSSTESAVGFFVGGGLALFLNDNVALETILGYKNIKVENKDGTGGFNMRIGFQVYISRLKKLVTK
jgi:opacity protein-like surface antigen